LRDDEIGCRPVAEFTPLTTGTPLTAYWDELGMDVRALPVLCKATL
jgi:hypothetical protein